MKARFIRNLLLVSVVFLPLGCATSKTEKNLVDGTTKKRGGWFQLGEAERYNPEPHERRVDDVLAHPR